MGRRSSGSHVSPSSRSTQPDHTDNLFDWIRSQNNPRKPQPLKPRKTTAATAVGEAFATAIAQKNAPVDGQVGEGEDTDWKTDV